MKAIIQSRYGGPSTLALAEVATPTPGPAEVLVRVRASSINAADALLMRGVPYIARVTGLKGPRGRDVAGVVEAVGSAVTAFTPGDEVYAETTAGAFAEFTVVPAARLARKPANLTFEQAACVPIAGATALQAMRLARGEKVLVTGATGGVGCFAVQLATVDTVGRDETIAGSYDSIIDIAGARSLRSLRRALAPTGTLVLVSGKGGRVLGPLGRILAGSLLGLVGRKRTRVLAAGTTAADLDELRSLIEAGTVVPQVSATYTLAEVPAALHLFETRRPPGKIAISVG
jgi:NADPH:quinone reductase-like Zn-dependent oxidoreductase